MNMTRRKFLGTAAAAVFAGGTLAQGRVFGANDRIRIGVAGLNGRGRRHISVEEMDPQNLGGFNSPALPSEVTAICDPDREVLERRAEQLRHDFGKRPKTYVDYRDMLADSEIDAVSIASPNHWHSLMAIWACQAGKDVFVEKPLSHNVWEGRQLVAAAQKYGRIVQHGTQSRAHVRWVRTMQRLRAGVIGDVYMARALCYKGRGTIGFEPPSNPPPHLDWNLWQGPAEERQYCANYVHYDWHWFWHYGNGDIGNQGVHQMDIGVWGLGMRELPRRVSSTGGRYGYEDQGETPNTQIATFTYDDGRIMVFEVRGLVTNSEAGVGVGNLFYGSEGFAADTQFYRSEGSEIPDEGEGAQEIRVDDNQYRAFLNAVRSRNQDDIAGTALEGHISCAHIHLANIAYRLGRTIEVEPATGAIVGDEDASALLTRAYRAPFEVPQLA